MTMKTTMASVALVALLTPAMAVAADGKIGSFGIKSAKDPISDIDTSSIYTAGSSDSVGVIWGCREDGLNVMFRFGRYLMGRGDGITVQYRFPAQPAVELTWGLAVSHEGAFLPLDKVAAFTAMAKSQTQVALRATDKDGDVITETVALTGFSQALGTLSCAKSFGLTTTLTLEQ